MTLDRAVEFAPQTVESLAKFVDFALVAVQGADCLVVMSDKVVEGGTGLSAFAVPGTHYAVEQGKHLAWVGLASVAASLGQVALHLGILGIAHPDA